MIRVTEAIAKSGIGPSYESIPEAYLSAKAQLGTSVHELCAKASRQKAKLPDTESGAYARKFVEWLWLTKAKVLRTEFEVRGSVSGIPYVGHVDAEVGWNGDFWVIDIKTTSSLFSAFGVQLAAYQMAMDTLFRRRAVLWLRKDKPAQLVCDAPIIRGHDAEMWKAIMISNNWVKGARL